MSSEGYRGSLPPRKDRLAAPWVLLATAVFVLIFVVAFLGIPTKLFPEPTPSPLPSIIFLASPSASGSPAVSASPGASASISASASPAP
ncbi:MAG: hypothetical protein E6J47_06875 [Chloroflexi bacterium]|nr:MAG: hypothetical protein E6J47_06875 [Chloroflexota bacterium]